jgi:hypothetical protein
VVAVAGRQRFLDGKRLNRERAAGSSKIIRTQKTEKSGIWFALTSRFFSSVSVMAAGQKAVKQPK